MYHLIPGHTLASMVDIDLLLLFFLSTLLHERGRPHPKPLHNSWSLSFLPCICVAYLKPLNFGSALSAAWWQRTAVVQQGTKLCAPKRLDLEHTISNWLHSIDSPLQQCAWCDFTSLPPRIRTVLFSCRSAQLLNLGNNAPWQ
jgi:hypothetical protein